jgi:hypothetical protein
MLMVRSSVRLMTGAIAVACLTSVAAAVPPYSEDFSTGIAGWRYTTANAVPLVSVPTGGPVDNGAYIRNNLATLAGSPQAPTTALLFRAQQNYAGINLDYTGDWIAAGVREVRAWVRHNVPDPLAFVGRFATGANSPAAFYTQTTLVAPNAWTEIVFDVTPTSPLLTSYEGGSHQSVFQNFDNSGIGNMQFGVSVPNALLNTGPYVFEFDNVSIVTPEPATGALAVVSVAGLGMMARRKSRG